MPSSGVSRLGLGTLSERDGPDVGVDAESEFRDQGDAKWIVIRGQLRGHNVTPFGWPTPGRPISHPRGVFGVF
jgi:hypothetical protein